VGVTEIDGFRCYAPERARECVDYPREGFELTAALEADSFWCRARNRILRDAIERFTDRSRRLAMLEIGCGIGGVVAELRRFAHLELTASEISLQGLHFARSRFPDVDFIQLDATAMPFKADFDVVGAFDVLEHIAEDERAIAGVHAALRPGGLFILTVPQYEWMWSTLDEVVCHKRRYGRADLLQKLRRNRFDVLFCSSFVTALFPAMAMSRLLARKAPARRTGEAAFASEVTFSPATNRACDWIMRLDEAALRAGISLPFGGSLLVVARQA
jgi:SAM-dependent methyltransferase